MNKNSYKGYDKINIEEFFGFDYAPMGGVMVPTIDYNEGIIHNMQDIIREYHGRRNLILEVEKSISSFERADYLDNYKKFLVKSRKVINDFYNDKKFYSRTGKSKEQFNQERDLPVKYINTLEDIANSLGKKLTLEDYPKEYASLMRYSYNKIVAFSLKEISASKDLDLDMNNDEDVLKARERYEQYDNLVHLVKGYITEGLKEDWDE